jgi:hypothetical protein
MQNLNHHSGQSHQLLTATVAVICTGSAIILVTLALYYLHRPSAGILLILGGFMGLIALWPISLVHTSSLRTCIHTYAYQAIKNTRSITKATFRGGTTMISNIITHLEQNWALALALSIVSGITTALLGAYTMYMFLLLPKQITGLHILSTFAMVIVTNIIWTAFQNGRPRNVS